MSICSLTTSGFSWPPLLSTSSSSHSTGIFHRECHTSMSNSYSGTIPVCLMYFVNNQLNLTLRSIYSLGTTSSLLSEVLAKFPMETSKSDLRVPSGTGSGVPVSSPLVHSSQDNPRISPTESRTGPLLLHGCLSDWMGSQLERLPHLRILDYRAPGVPHKLVRDGSSHWWFSVGVARQLPTFRIRGAPDPGLYLPIQ